ncbi:ABC transporter substrate-binding protein [Paradesulfitobacterium aromaticivorans]
MKKLLAVSLSLLLLFLAGCGSTESAQTSKQPIRIGVVAGLSGAGALPGQMEVNGAKLATEEINAAGGVDGRQIELVVEDSQSTNPGAVAAFQKVVGKDLVAVIGPVFSTQVQAILPYVEKSKLPVLVGGTEASITESGNPWIFRIRPDDGIAMKVMMQFIVNDIKAKKIAILFDTDAFGTNGKKSLEAEAKNYPGVDTKAIGMASHAGDYTAQILNVKQYGPDVMVILSPYPEDGAIIMRQAHEQGVNAAKIGSAAVASANTVKLAGANAEGLYGVTDYFPEQNEVAKKYAEQFKAKFSAVADMYSAYAYDAVHILSKIIAKNGDTPDKVQQGLKSFSGWTGNEGEYAFDVKGNGLHAYTVTQNKNGNPIFVKVIKAN